MPVHQSGAGAPTGVEYVTTASSGPLTAEVNIPGLAGHADRNAIGGAGVSYEFDSGASPLTWSAAVDTETVDSTIPSHLYVQDDGTESYGTYAWAPAGAFDIRAKISFGAEVGTSASSPVGGLGVWNTGTDAGIFSVIRYDGTADQVQIRCYTRSASSSTQRGVSQVIGSNFAYLRLVRDGANNCSFYYSFDGITWLLVVTQALTFTVAKAGLYIAAASLTTTMAVDWIRSSV